MELPGSKITFICFLIFNIDWQQSSWKGSSNKLQCSSYLFIYHVVAKLLTTWYLKGCILSWFKLTFLWVVIMDFTIHSLKAIYISPFEKHSLLIFKLQFHFFLLKRRRLYMLRKLFLFSMFYRVVVPVCYFIGLGYVMFTICQAELLM